MAFNVNQMRAELVGGGARPSLFQVQITNVVDNIADNKLVFMAKAAALPASNLGTIEVPYFGRKIKVVGDRTFEEWTVTVINDEDFLVRNAMEKWMNALNSHVGNTRDVAFVAPERYKTQGQIIQYSKSGAKLREYEFNGLYPSNISAIEMNWETTDTIEEFTVTFQYDWWEVKSGITGISTT
jgi:hypothetical protein